MGLVILILVVLAFLILIANIAVVQQSRAYVVERLGAFHSVWGVGIHFKVPFIERVAKAVSLKEQVVDFAPQPVITKDNGRGPHRDSRRGRRDRHRPGRSSQGGACRWPSAG